MNTVNEITLMISSVFIKRSGLMKSRIKSIRHNYTFSETHTIDYIGKHDDANVTRIAASLGMTRGAISKITKRLIRNRHIVSYRRKDNRKELYFRLTTEGENIFREHRKIHREFNEIELDFFKKYDKELLEKMRSILEDYDAFLTQRDDLYLQER